MAESEKKTDAKAKDEPKPGEAAPLHGKKEDEDNFDPLKMVMMLAVMVIGMNLFGAMDGPNKGLGNIFEKIMGNDNAAPATPKAPAAPALAAAKPAAPTARL